MVFSKLKELFLDILFPKVCVGCGKEERYLCVNCTLFMSEVEFSCPVCDKTELFGRRHNGCKAKNNPDGLVSFWNYEGLAKQLTLKSKYNSLIDIPKELADYGLLTIRENKHRFSEFTGFLFDEKTIISYVPLHKKSEIKRGFDQSKIAAEHLAKRINKEVVTLLKREKETKSQTKLNKEERFLNTKNAFSFTHNKGAEQVVLVDDVWTSGATARECTKTLKENGVKKVWILTLTKTS